MEERRLEIANQKKVLEEVTKGLEQEIKDARDAVLETALKEAVPQEEKEEKDSKEQKAKEEESDEARSQSHTLLDWIKRQTKIPGSESIVNHAQATKVMKNAAKSVRPLVIKAATNAGLTFDEAIVSLYNLEGMPVKGAHVDHVQAKEKIWKNIQSIISRFNKVGADTEKLNLADQELLKELLDKEFVRFDGKDNYYATESYLAKASLEMDNLIFATAVVNMSKSASNTQTFFENLPVYGKTFWEKYQFKLEGNKWISTATGKSMSLVDAMKEWASFDLIAPSIRGNYRVYTE